MRTQGSQGRLDGKRALISGTGGGIGRATALLCAREGAHVVGCDLHPQSSEETVAPIPEKIAASASVTFLADLPK